MMDRVQDLFIRAISAGAFRRHCIQAGNCRLNQRIHITTVRVQTRLPSSAVASFGSAQYASRMTSSTERAKNSLTRARLATSSRAAASHCFSTRIAYQTHFTVRLKALRDGLFVGRCSKGITGNYYQHGRRGQQNIFQSHQLMHPHHSYKSRAQVRCLDNDREYTGKPSSDKIANAQKIHPTVRPFTAQAWTPEISMRIIAALKPGSPPHGSALHTTHQ